MVRTSPAFRFVLLFALFVVVQIPAKPVHAQLEELTGRRVRLTLAAWPGAVGTSATGVLTGISADSLMLERGGRVTPVPRSYVQGVDVSNGSRRMTGRGALIGVATGAVVLGGLAAAANDPNHCTSTGGWICFEFTTGQAFVLGAIPGALLGAGIGALVGRATRTDRWEAVDLDLTSLPAGGRRGLASTGLRLVVGL